MKLVLVHGFLGSALNWGPIRQRLIREIPAEKLVIPDLLGHGKKLFDGKMFGFSELCHDLAMELPKEEFVAVGHSFGLRPLLALSDTMRDRMKVIIAEDSSPEISEAGSRDLRKIFDEVPLPFKSRDEARQFLDESFKSDPKIARFLMTNIREVQAGEHAWRFNRDAMSAILDEAIAHPLWSEWSNFPGPIYMILGEDSGFVSAQKQKKAVELRGSLETELVQIPQSGHWVHADQADKFSEEVLRIYRIYSDS